MIKYLERPNKNRQTLQDNCLYEILHDGQDGWHVNKASARIAFLDLVDRHVDHAIIQHLPNNANLAMVTLLDRRFAFPIDEAREFQIAKLTQWVERALEGFSFLGFVEPQLIGNFRQGRGRDGKRLVHFHVHCLVWDFNRAALSARKRQVNTFIEPLFRGPTTMHVKHIKLKEWRRQIRYMLKGQLNVKNLSQKSEAEHIEKHDLNVWSKMSAFTLYPHLMRDADKVRMARVMEGRTFAEMIVAGGDDGLRVHAAVRRDVTRTVPTSGT